MFSINKRMCLISFNRILNISQTQVKYSSLLSSENAFTYKSDLTPEKEMKVLEILNGSNAEQLLRYSVTKNRIKNIENWKNKRGPFKSLSEVLEVDGLGEKVLDKICENIINYKVQQTEISKSNIAMNRRLKQLVTPVLQENILGDLHTASGIQLTSTGISWARLNKNQNEISNWNCKDFNSLPKKMSHNETFNLAVNIVQDIPPSDIYIFENTGSLCPQNSAKSTALSSYNQHLELSSMLIALLNTGIQHNISLQLSKEKPLQQIENRVYFLKSKLPARLFGILVGNERVSAVKTATQLLNQEGSSPLLPCTPISVDAQLKKLFNAQSPANKELLGQALLLIISFMDLCVYKNQASLSVILSHKN